MEVRTIRNSAGEYAAEHSEDGRILSRYWYNKEKMYHRDGAPAIELYGERSWNQWWLNGVCVPQWLSETPAEKIDPRRILGVYNSEIRREFIKKVGIERVCYALNTEVVDKIGNYELLMLSLGDRKRPYLKMLNPSCPDVWHIEGVHPNCRTVKEALTWRNGTDVEPKILT